MARSKRLSPAVWVFLGITVMCISISFIAGKRKVGYGNRQALDISVLTSIDGRSVRLGKTGSYLLIFFSSSCKKCIDLLAMVSRERSKTSVVAIGDSPKSALFRFKARYKTRYSLIADPAGKLFLRFGINEVPTLFLIDGGFIVRRWVK